MIVSETVVYEKHSWARM